MNRTTSVYTILIGITDRMAAYRALDKLLQRVAGPTLVGSGADERGCFVRLRLADDDVAVRWAQHLTTAFGKSRYTAPVTLSTGLGVHYRTITF